MRDDWAQGYDISYWQERTPPVAGRSFMIVRASYGDHPDSRYDMHARNIRAAGLHLGAYLFLRNQSPADQVATFLRVAGDADFWAVDYEKDRGHPHVTQAQTREVIRRIQATGRKVGLYATQYTMFDAGQDWDWVADWRDEMPPGDWKIWQYRGSPLDLDVFRGTPQEMEAWLGMARLPITNGDIHRIRIKARSPLYSPDGAKVETTGDAIERTAFARVHLGSGGPVYWAVNTGVNGQREIVFVKLDDAVDLGELATGGPSTGDVAAARQEGFADAKAKAIAAVQGI